MRKGNLPIILLLLFTVPSCLSRKAALDEPLKVSSPDGNLTISISMKAEPEPCPPGERVYYRVSYKGTPVLTDSPLGLDFVDSGSLDRDFEVLCTDRHSHDRTW